MPNSDDKVRELNKAISDLRNALRSGDADRVRYIAWAMTDMQGCNYRRRWTTYRAMVSEEFDDPCLTTTG